MGVVIHDDYWEAAQAMPDKQRRAFLFAIIEYGFTKNEPKGNPPWMPTFIAIRKRIELGEEKSDRMRKVAKARWSKAKANAQGNADASPARDAQADANAYAHAYACADQHACETHNAEYEDEYEDEDEYEGESPPQYPWRCLDALNRALGTSYASMPSQCTHTLERFEEKYDISEVEAMIAYKRDEWRGTKFSKALTPNTLFSPEHFEQYIHQSKQSETEASEFDEFDNIISLEDM